MKIAPLILLAAAGGWLGYVALHATEPTYVPPRDAPPTELTGEVPAGHVVRTLAVEGMCCSSCPGRLFDAILAIDGVQAAAVDAERSTVSAVVPEALDASTLASALTFGQYSARPEGP